jgi:uncharacterized damage-inducible protein DinB
MQMPHIASTFHRIQLCLANTHTPTLHSALREQLQHLLDGGQAHATFDDAVKNLPSSLRGTVPDNLPYSPWQILEHIRITQRDILEFSTNEASHYKSLKWPEEYWPKSPVPLSDSAWEDSIQHIRADRKAFEKLLDSATESELIQPFPWGDGQTLLREAFLIADHTAYHTGELIVLRRLLGAWKK